MLTFELAFFDDYIPSWRTHDDSLACNVLVLVIDGRVHYRVNGEEIIGERGDFLFIPRAVRRTGSNDPSGPHRKYTVTFRYCEGFASAIPFLAGKRVVRAKLRNFQYVQRRFQRLYEEQRNPESYRAVVCQGILQELIGMVARELEKPEAAPMKIKYAEIVKRYLQEHYREPIGIERLSKLIGRSENYTIGLFREVVGQSPIKYVHHLRVVEACNLLLHSDMSVAAISEYLGYYDTSYFFRIFKKAMSMSPTDFRLYGSRSDAALPLLP